MNMTLSTPEKNLRPQNPFEKVKLQVSPTSSPPHRAMGAPLRATVPALPVRTRNHSLSGTHLWRKKQTRLKMQAILMSVVGLALVFVLLPMPVQRRFFSMVGLGPITPQTLLSVPLPVDYDYVSSPFGRRWGRLHQGVDLAAPQGAAIYAASAGRVIHSGWELGYGKSVVVDHGDGVKTRYAHCFKVFAQSGARVEKGQIIAQVGSTGHSTGPHLHFEVLVNGVRKNPAWFYKFDQKPHWYALKVKQGKNWLQAFSERLADWAKS